MVRVSTLNQLQMPVRVGIAANLTLKFQSQPIFPKRHASADDAIAVFSDLDSIDSEQRRIRHPAGTPEL